jgi:hypothetical protein
VEENPAKENCGQPTAPLPVLRPPGEVRTQLTAIIAREGGEVCIRYPDRCDTFKDIVKTAGLRWRAAPDEWSSSATKCWRRPVSLTMGNPADFMADVTHRLLASGYAVEMKDLKAHNKAVSGEFEPEQTSWVQKCIARGSHDGWFKLTWAYGDDLYRKVRSLPGSCYVGDGAVYVPPGSADAVVDFAAEHGFRLSPGAQEIVAEQRRQLAESLVVNIRRPGVVKTKSAAQPVGIEESLRDE